MTRHYTASEIEAANDTDLPELLSSLGYHVKRVGRFYTTQEMDSLRIKDRRTWYRYSESTGGDAIAFLRRFHGMSFPEAVGYLLDFNGCSTNTLPRQRIRPPPQRGRPVFVLPPPYNDNERVCAYLRGRGIALGIVDSFIEMGLLYEDMNHNCVFVGRDSTGIPRFAAKRGTWGSFKCDTTGSDKRIAFRFPCDPALHDISVFESPIDLMSWFTLHGQANAVALCGLHDAPLETYLDDNPHISRIVLCLDADGPGREAAERLGTKYRALGYGIDDLIPSSGKDWNEYLQMRGDVMPSRLSTLLTEYPVNPIAP